MSSRPTSPSVASGVLTLLLTLLGWASVPLFLRYFSDYVDFWTSNGWRYGFSAVVWAPVLIIGAMRHRLPPGLWRAAIVPSVVNAAGQVCFAWAHYRIDPALLTFGLRSQLLFVAIGAWIMFPGERVVLRAPGYLIGAAILITGMIGVIALKAPPGAEAATVVARAGSFAQRGTSSSYLEGVSLAIVSGLLFACYGLSVRKFMNGINSVVAFAAICQYTAAALVGLMLIFGTRGGLIAMDLSGGQLAMLLGSALIGIAIGHVFYYMSLARLGVAVTAGVLQLQPFCVAVASLGLFGEKLTAGQWISGCVAVGGALLMLAVQYRLSRRRHVSEKSLAIAEGESGA